MFFYYNNRFDVFAKNILYLRLNNFDMNVTKFDLQISDYFWTENDKLYNGMPSRREFNRNNGSQVLFLINCYTSIQGALTSKQLLALEQFIVWAIPAEARSEISVLKNILHEFQPGE